MGGLAGILAGVATISAGVALVRFLDRKAREARAALEETGLGNREDLRGAMLDYERDPDDGVYRAKA